MARASIVIISDDGSTIRLTFHTEAEHPDALDECATRVVRMYDEWMALEQDDSE